MWCTCYRFVLEVEHFYNYDLDNIVTPLNIEAYARLLKQTNYPIEETRFLVDGFKTGFDIGYRGTRQRQARSKNYTIHSGE